MVAIPNNVFRISFSYGRAMICLSGNKTASKTWSEIFTVVLDIYKALFFYQILFRLFKLYKGLLKALKVLQSFEKLRCIWIKYWKEKKIGFKDFYKLIILGG